MLTLISFRSELGPVQGLVCQRAVSIRLRPSAISEGSHQACPGGRAEYSSSLLLVPSGVERLVEAQRRPARVEVLLQAGGRLGGLGRAGGRRRSRALPGRDGSRRRA